MDEDEELLALEREFWQAMKDRDPEAPTRLTDETSIVVGPQGIGEVDRAVIGERVAEAPYRLADFAFDENDLHVKWIGDDTAVVAYPVHERLEVDGETLELDAFEATVWVRRDGRWVAALHTETLKGDPFGRDRRRPQRRGRSPRRIRPPGARPRV